MNDYRSEVASAKGDQLDQLVAARNQMEQLVRAIVEIGSDLDLDVTLKRIVNAALELAGARNGTLGIRGSDGTLVSFVDAGMDDAQAGPIGELRTGEGLMHTEL